MVEDNYDNAAALACMIDETRQLHAVIDGVKYALRGYPDLDRLSLVGAINYLIRYRKLVDEIKDELNRASRNPDKAPMALARIERLLDDIK